MNSWKAIAAAAGLVVAGWMIHAVGFTSGLRSAPEYAAQRASERDADEAAWQQITAPGDARSLACERVFRIIGEEIRDEWALEAEERDAFLPQRD